MTGLRLSNLSCVAANVSYSHHGNDCPITTLQHSKWQRHNEHSLNCICDIPGSLNFSNFYSWWTSFTFATRKCTVTTKRSNTSLSENILQCNSQAQRTLLYYSPRRKAALLIIVITLIESSFFILIISFRWLFIVAKAVRIPKWI